MAAKIIINNILETSQKYFVLMKKCWNLFMVKIYADSIAGNGSRYIVGLRKK
jgi:hypothetical protein